MVFRSTSLREARLYNLTYLSKSRNLDPLASGRLDYHSFHKYYIIKQFRSTSLREARPRNKSPRCTSKQYLDPLASGRLD